MKSNLQHAEFLSRSFSLQGEYTIKYADSRQEELNSHTVEKAITFLDWMADDKRVNSSRSNRRLRFPIFQRTRVSDHKRERCSLLALQGFRPTLIAQILNMDRSTFNKVVKKIAEKGELHS